MPYKPCYAIRGLGVAVLLAMPIACGRCIENVVPPQCTEHTHFCAEYMGQNNLTSAEARCKLALEFCPTHAEPYNLLGMIEHSRGRIERAIEYFKQALSYKEDFPEALNNLGAIHLERHENDVAADLFKQALEVDPGYQVARRNYATVLMYLGEPERARDEFLKCVEVDPQNCDCRLGLGVLSLSEELWDDAKVHFQKTTEICPNMAEGFYNLCYAYLRLLRCADAVDACTHAVSLKTDYIEAKKNMIEAYQCLALQDATLKKIMTEIKNDPSNPELHFRLGKLYEDEQLWERALGEYQNTVRLNANFVIAYYHAARMYDRTTRTQETIDTCQAFVDRVRDIRYEKQKAWCIGRVQQLQYDAGGAAIGP